MVVGGTGTGKQPMPKTRSSRPSDPEKSRVWLTAQSKMNGRLPNKRYVDSSHHSPLPDGMHRSGCSSKKEMFAKVRLGRVKRIHCATTRPRTRRPE
ncbi:hypothetical protein MTO96_013633 [Rhipicephalus appendiculatus]